MRTHTWTELALIALPMALVFDGQSRYLGSVELSEGLRVHEVGSSYIAGGVVDEVGVERVQLHALYR